MSLRDEILATEDLPLEEVYISEWDKTVYVRNMTGLERDQYEASLLENRDKSTKERLSNVRASLVVVCTVDEQGNRIFNNEDRVLVGGKSANALDKIVAAAQKLNGLADSDVEEIAGNLDPSGSEDSISE